MQGHSLPDEENVVEDRRLPDLQSICDQPGGAQPFNTEHYCQGANRLIELELRLRTVLRPI